MSYTARAGLSIVVGVGAVLFLLARASTLADVAGGLIVGVALLVFIRSVLSLAGETGERPPPPPDTAPRG